MNNNISLTDPVPELNGVVNFPTESLDKINTSIQATPQDVCIEEMAAFLNMIVRRTRIHMETQLVPLFQHQHINLSLFREKLCTISAGRKVAT